MDTLRAGLPRRCAWQTADLGCLALQGRVLCCWQGSKAAIGACPVAYHQPVSVVNSQQESGREVTGLAACPASASLLDQPGWPAVGITSKSCDGLQTADAGLRLACWCTGVAGSMRRTRSKFTADEALNSLLLLQNCAIDCARACGKPCQACRSSQGSASLASPIRSATILFRRLLDYWAAALSC